MKKAVWVFALGLCACAHSPEKKAVKDNSAAQGEFDRGIKALDAQQYDVAARIFDGLLLSKPGTEMELVTIFDSGSAYEGLGDCSKASDRYRQVIRASAGKFRRIEAEAMFRLSLMYECLGHDTKAVTALLDARKRGKDLSYETLNAEIPARLAAAYARLNNREKALEYFNQAARGLKGVIANRGALSRESVARTLFLMGKLSPTQREAAVDPNTYMQSVSMQQPYLLQGMELAIKPWSARAEDDLRLAYQNVWKFKFDDAEKQRAFYTRALQSLHELRNIRLPKPDAAEDAVFASFDKTETKLQNELAQSGESTPLTEEAKKRETLRRQGRLIDPEVKKKKANKNEQ